MVRCEVPQFGVARDTKGTEIWGHWSGSLAQTLITCKEMFEVRLYSTKYWASVHMHVRLRAASGIYGSYLWTLMNCLLLLTWKTLLTCRYTYRSEAPMPDAVLEHDRN